MSKQLLHTFVICAYKESPYLDECIESLKNQSVKSEIIIVTHTPCDYISDMAAKYDLTLFVNEGEGGITQDWNFGLSKVKTRFATIAHQDDTYEPDYTKELLSRMRKCKKSLIAFADYYELRGEEKVDRTKMLNIKRFMLLPLRPWFTWKSRFIRRRILSFGDAICCPSVMYCLDNLEQPIFHNHFICCEDWEAWEKLSRLEGEFVYVPKSLMSHRIHEESTTTKTLEQGGRIAENMEMYQKFWPKWVAKLINHFYTDSEKSNDLS